MAVKHVLVVDDDPDVADYFSSFLGDHGYRVVSAGSGAAAMEVLEHFRPDVILIDVLLPGKSGLDLLVKLRQMRRWAQTPVVIVTGNDTVLADDCRSYLGSHGGLRGPDGVLGKPVDRDALLRLLGKVLEA